MNKRSVESLARGVEKEKAKIAAARDRLRAMVDDAEAILESVDAALIDLQNAVDVLSQYV